MADKIKKIQKEIHEIQKAIEDDETDIMIYDSYENYNKKMLDFIKLKDRKWFDKLFIAVAKMLKDGYNTTKLKETLYDIMDKMLANHITEQIFGDDGMIDDDKGECVDDEVCDDVGGIDVPLDEAVNNFEWRKNQTEAIENTIRQDFKSGVHNQIMGAGKTYIIFNTIKKHCELKPNRNLYVIACFRQEILKDMIFDSDGEIDDEKVDKLEKHDIIDLNDFCVIDRVHVKDKNIKLSKKKPSLLIVNTDYLKVMNIDYTKVNFLILDECHSVSAGKLYEKLRDIKYVYKKHIIGFSATPLRKRAEVHLVDIFSESNDTTIKKKKLNIISNYDFVTAIRDEVILPPQYTLCEVNKTLNGKIGKDNKSIMKQVLSDTLTLVPYKKVIGWCRTIEQMKIYYKYIKKEFPNIEIFCSCFCDVALQKLKFNTNWHRFARKKNNCIMLCVNRFREGSDIMNLDTAIYLDAVRDRSLLVALQTSGRVLRKDKEGKKQHGMIIDSFVNSNGIQIEAMTAERIITYYKQIFALCDENEYEDQKETYDEMINICKNMKYDEKNKQIIVKYDDIEKHNMTIKLQLKTKTFDFSKLKIQIGAIIDKMYKVDKEIKFKIIVDKLKAGGWFSINTVNFWETYDMISKKDKEKYGLPTRGDLYKEYSDIFDSASWYQILDLDTSRWASLSRFKKILRQHLFVEKYCGNIDKMYKTKIMPINHRMPPNPRELYGIKSIYSEMTKCQKIDL